MRKRFGRTATNLLLSALVLAWGIVPPAVRHGHDGGDEPNHRHKAVAHHSHEHGDHDHPSDGASRSVESQVSPSALRGLVFHLHWSFFGVEFSVPMSEDDQSDDARHAAEPAIVRLVASVPAPVLHNSTFMGGFSATGAQPALDLPVGLTSSLTNPNLTRSAPLCDRARHERSGVLLV